MCILRSLCIRHYIVPLHFLRKRIIYLSEQSSGLLHQRTLTYFVRGNITVRLTSCLTGLDSAILLNWSYIFPLRKCKDSKWSSLVEGDEQLDRPIHGQTIVTDMFYNTGARASKTWRLWHHGFDSRIREPFLFATPLSRQICHRCKFCLGRDQEQTSGQAKDFQVEQERWQRVHLHRDSRKGHRSYQVWGGERVHPSEDGLLLGRDAHVQAALQVSFWHRSSSINDGPYYN